jgi:hypothetical protein
MLPTKEQLTGYLINKMTNKNIADIHGTTFQKIIQLIKKYELNPNKLRRTDYFIVYEHWCDDEVVYVGSGVWYRCRRYTNRRHSEHRALMKERKITYSIVSEFLIEEDAKKFEVNLIKKYKQKGQARFNIKTS